MAIIDIYNKKRGITYVYDSHSYWDKELKQPRSRRRLLGRRDPETGELVPTRKSKPQSSARGDVDSDTDYATLYRRSQKTISERDAVILRLRRELADARRHIRKLEQGAANAAEDLMGLLATTENAHA